MEMNIYCKTVMDILNTFAKTHFCDKIRQFQKSNKFTINQVSHGNIVLL